MTTPLRLHDIENAQAFVQRVLDRRLNEWSARLEPDQKEDAFSYLLMTAWQLSEVYDPNRRLSFSTYCHRILRLRLADWYRDRFGDSRYGDGRPEEISLEQMADALDCTIADLVESATDYTHEEVLTRVALAG